MANDRKRFYKRPIFFIPAIVVAIPAAWLAWWLGSPLFINKTVVEPFPTVPAVDALAPSPPTTPPPAEVAQPPPGAEVAVVQAEGGSSPAATAAPLTTTGTTPPDATATTVAAEPIALFSGMFKDADSRHHGSGDATIYELADGTKVLRVENLDVTNGPDLHVFLAPVADAEKRDDVMAEGYLDLGELKGNKGDQNYIILGDLDLENEWTVVIYCVPFHVIFSTAPLAAATG